MKNSTAYEPQSYDIYMSIAAEVERQYQKWGLQDHPNYEWVAIAAEELGEVAKAAIDETRDNGEELNEEIVQLAAVCVSWLNSRQRRVEADEN